MNVISPLLQIKNGQHPKGLRKVEFNFQKADLKNLIKTVPKYSVASIFQSLEKEIEIYNEFRINNFPKNIVLKSNLQKKVLEYFSDIKTKT